MTSVHNERYCDNTEWHLRVLNNMQTENTEQYDGVNLINTILGKSKSSRKEPVFYSRPPDRKNYYGFENLPDLAVREGDWKLLCDYDGGRQELYNIVNDPEENRNLADVHTERAKTMTQKVMSWYKSMQF